MKFCYIPNLPFQKFTRAISPKGKQWTSGDVISIFFIGGNIHQRNQVIVHSAKWLKHINITFDFTEDIEKSDVRISFRRNLGSWSYMGTDCLFIPSNKATMNFGWIDEGVILHEFGHMLGLAHEHQHPNAMWQWNTRQVISDLSGPPNNWNIKTIRHNVLNRYKEEQVYLNSFDPKSIMLYIFPSSWTHGEGPTMDNNTLSVGDIRSVKKLYPKETMLTNIIRKYV